MTSCLLLSLEPYFLFEPVEWHTVRYHARKVLFSFFNRVIYSAAFPPWIITEQIGQAAGTSTGSREQYFCKCFLATRGWCVCGVGTVALMEKLIF